MQLLWALALPSDSRDGTPSPTDLDALLSVLSWNGQHGRSAPFSVGLIYTASRISVTARRVRSFIPGPFAAWDKAIWTRAVCEPAA